MSIEYKEHVREQIIQNGIPVKDVEYDKIEKNGNILVQGHYNNQQFRYIKPNSKQKKVSFESSPAIPIQIERMPNLNPLPDSIQIYKRKGITRKNRKSSKKVARGSRKKRRFSNKNTKKR